VHELTPYNPSQQRLATAEWSDPAEVSRQLPHGAGRFWLGRSAVDGDALGFTDDRHVMLVSGNRAGKGTTTIVPNLLLWPGSVVVIDPKGENATVAASRRGKGSDHAKGMGQAVHVLDPFNIISGPAREYRATFNPLDVLDPEDPRTIDEAGRLADALVVINPNSNDPFWDQSARALVKGLVLHVLTDPQYEGRRNLVTVRTLLMRGDHEGVAELREMGEEPPSAHALLWETVARNEALGGVIAQLGEGMASMASNSAKTLESVMQVAARNTEFLDSPGMRELVRESSFDLASLKTDPAGVSIFLSLPQRYMGEHFRWLRMMVTLIVAEMEATPGQPAAGHRVLMVLDEFAGLKQLEVIENAVAQIAGFGVKLFFVLQSLEQLKKTYKEGWETFMSNAALKLFFGVDDHFTREYVSKLIGETELVRTTATSSETEGESQSRTVSRSKTKGTSSSMSEGENDSISSSVSRGRSRSAKSLPLNLHNTAHVLRGLTGEIEAGRNTGSSQSRSRGTSRTRSVSSNESETESVSETVGTSFSRTSGSNEGIHKRPLITPDEIGRYFARVDDTDSPIHPGLGLVLLPGRGPIPVRRTNYFADRRFVGLFDPHPDHPFKALPPPPPVVEYNIGFHGLDRLRLMSGKLGPNGPADPEAEWLVEKGDRVVQGQNVMRLKNLVGTGTGIAKMPGELVFQSPVKGTVRFAADFDFHSFRDRWMIIMIADGDETPDVSFAEKNTQKIADYCETMVERAGSMVRSMMIPPGILVGLLATSLIWLAVGWPNRWLWLAAVGLLVIAFFVYRAALGMRIAVMSMISEVELEHVDGVFVIEGPFNHDPDNGDAG
jgi:type IV secretory pathway TraG/TraD family ATPase VirD4